MGKELTAPNATTSEEEAKTVATEEEATTASIEATTAVPEEATASPESEALIPEVISADDSAAYKPRISDAEAKGAKTGNFLPLRGAIIARLPEDTPTSIIEAEVTSAVAEVTISQCLKDEMKAPNAMLTVGDDIVSNARAIGKVLVNKALAGDMSAIREVLNRTEGRVPSVSMNKSATVKVSGSADSIAALMDKMDKNKA